MTANKKFTKQKKQNSLKLLKEMHSIMDKNQTKNKNKICMYYSMVLLYGK